MVIIIYIFHRLLPSTITTVAGSAQPEAALSGLSLSLTRDGRHRSHAYTSCNKRRAVPLERATHRYTRALHTTQGHHRPDKARAPVSDGRQQLAVKAAEADL